MEYKELNKQFWGQHLWARGYFVASSGNVTDEVIAEYIKNQDLEERRKNDNFEIGQLQAALAASPNLPALAGNGSVKEKMCEKKVLFSVQVYFYFGVFCCLE